MLINKGANLEALDKQRLTPLHWACHLGHHEIARLLINGGAQLEVRQEDGSTPLNLACTSMHPEVAQLLISNGAQVEALNDEKLTPLQEVCLSIFDDRPTVSEQNVAFKSALKMMQLLIDNGAHLDAPVVGLDSNTLLHIVIDAHTDPLKHKTLGMAQLLIKNGSPLEARDEESCMYSFTSGLHTGVSPAGTSSYQKRSRHTGQGKPQSNSSTLCCHSWTRRGRTIFDP